MTVKIGDYDLTDLADKVVIERLQKIKGEIYIDLLVVGSDPEGVDSIVDDLQDQHKFCDWTNRIEYLNGGIKYQDNTEDDDNTMEVTIDEDEVHQSLTVNEPSAIVVDFDYEQDPSYYAARRCYFVVGVEE